MDKIIKIKPVEMAYITRDGAPDSTEVITYHKIAPLEDIGDKEFDKYHVDSSVRHESESRLFKAWIDTVVMFSLPKVRATGRNVGPKSWLGTGESCIMCDKEIIKNINTGRLLCLCKKRAEEGARGVAQVKKSFAIKKKLFGEAALEEIARRASLDPSGRIDCTLPGVVDDQSAAACRHGMEARRAMMERYDREMNPSTVLKIRAELPITYMGSKLEIDRSVSLEDFEKDQVAKALKKMLQ